MKEYIKQFYTEGFATTFYQKPINFLKKKIKNKKLLSSLSMVIKIMYTLVFVTIGIVVLLKKLGVKIF